MKVKRKFFDEFNGVPDTTYTNNNKMNAYFDRHLFIYFDFIFFYRIDVNINRLLFLL